MRDDFISTHIYLHTLIYCNQIIIISYFMCCYRILQYIFTKLFF